MYVHGLALWCAKHAFKGVIFSEFCNSFDTSRCSCFQITKTVYVYM